jgi:diguanylate cyclase (GGDEF)-like protein/PAS domain S-box-containing protein
VKQLHNLLRRQLRRLALAPGRVPAADAWRALLELVSQSYGSADQDRYLLERSQDISSREMQELYQALQHERDTLELRVRERTAALAASEARFRSFTSLGSDWYWEQDAEFRYTAISGNFAQVTGFSLEEHVGRAPWDVPGSDAPEGGWVRHRARLASRETFYDVVLRRVHPARGATYAAISGEPVFDADGRFAGYRGIGREVTQQKLAEENASRLAQFDTLTSLYNRAAFFDRLAHALSVARRHGAALAVLFVDLDRFKDVNDAFGHLTGDEVLKIMAQRISATIRASDTAARLGGDEFVVLAENVVRDADVGEFAQRLLDALSEPFTLLGQECRLSASIGIALRPHDGDDGATLLKKADIAMYRAKDSGRNGLAFFSEVDSRPAAERIVMGAGIRRALDTDQLRLFYQPKVSVRTGAMTGVEALVRWEHPERGLLLPDLFIPLAEDSGLIRHIGRWVLHTACAQALAWQAGAPGPVRVAVNLSPRQFSDERLVIEIAHALAQTELPAHLLEIEVTESMMMEHPERAAETLREIREMGVHVSIDDFGTGYSSLARLKKFPIESVKIDRSFIRDIAVDPDDAAIVSAVIAMAHSLRLKVVAEGVETPEQVKFLRERGCDEIQGFYFSRPVPAAEIPAFAARHGGHRLEVVAGAAD